VGSRTARQPTSPLSVHGESLRTGRPGHEVVISLRANGSGIPLGFGEGHGRMLPAGD